VLGRQGERMTTTRRTCRRSCRRSRSAISSHPTRTVAVTLNVADADGVPERKAGANCGERRWKGNGRRRRGVPADGTTFGRCAGGGVPGGIAGAAVRNAVAILD
jgi:hypothetical protein